jgi:hypothetical protein
MKAKSRQFHPIAWNRRLFVEAAKRLVISLSIIAGIILLALWYSNQTP